MDDTAKALLDIPMQRNDAGAATVRDYLKALLLTLWSEGEGFSGKRPSGNGGWQHDLHRALVRSRRVKGGIDDEGDLEDYDASECNRLISDAIAAL